MFYIYVILVCQPLLIGFYSSGSGGVGGADKTVTIKCQRLNAESKQYEEVDVEVPAPIYETLRYVQVQIWSTTQFYSVDFFYHQGSVLTAFNKRTVKLFVSCF